MPDDVYRNQRESLQQENQQLRAEVARLRASPPTRLGIVDPTGAGMAARALGLGLGVAFALGWALVGGNPRPSAWALVAGLLGLGWALAFVRRVPRSAVPQGPDLAGAPDDRAWLRTELTEEQARSEAAWGQLADVARHLDLLFLTPAGAVAEAVAALVAERDRLAALLAGEAAPPTRDAVEAHHTAHGGEWLVSRVAVHPDRIRPMVLRLRNAGGDRIQASTPGTDYGGRWSDADPWRLMPGATWTRLDATGHPIGATIPEGP